MAQGKIGELPKLGEITLPVHLMNYDDKKGGKNFHSGFAYWWAGDSTSDVSDDDDNVIGMIGGKMGGHVEMVRYYPHNGQPHESGKYKQSVTAIIDVRDIWAQIETLLESEDVKVQFEGMEEMIAKYEALSEKEKEIKEMQNEAEEVEKEVKKNKKREFPDNDFVCVECGNGFDGEYCPTCHPNMIVTSNGTKYDIIENPHGWDLNENLKGRDVDFYEEITNNPNRTPDGLIPINIGCDVKMKQEDKILYTGDKLDNYDPGVVKLNISTWVGISSGAMHYYGQLEFTSPNVHPEGEPNTSTSCWLPIFERGKIELTHKLEKWELEKYPKSYEYYNVGDNYPGFYSKKEVIKRGKQVFKELFSSEWKLKIENNC